MITAALRKQPLDTRQRFPFASASTATLLKNRDKSTSALHPINFQISHSCSQNCPLVPKPRDAGHQTKGQNSICKLSKQNTPVEFAFSNHNTSRQWTGGSVPSAGRTTVLGLGSFNLTFSQDMEFDSAKQHRPAH